VVASVDDAAVGFAGAKTRLAIFFHQQHMQVITHQLPRNGAPDDAAANDDDIINHGLSP